MSTAANAPLKVQLSTQLIVTAVALFLTFSGMLVGATSRFSATEAKAVQAIEHSQKLEIIIAKQQEQLNQLSIHAATMQEVQANQQELARATNATLVKLGDKIDSLYAARFPANRP